MRRTDDGGLKNRSAVKGPALRTTLTLVGIGIVCSFAVSLGANGPGHAWDRGSNRQPGAPDQLQRVASGLDTIQRLPKALRATLQGTRTLSPKEVCRVAEGLLQEPAVTSIDAIAHYLSKNVHRWSDRMITLYLNADPKSAKATDKGEMRERVLRKWESDRAMAQRWLRGCGVAVRIAIGRGRPVIEREAADILSDVVSAIATGLRKNEPDAIAAAEALARAEEKLRVLH
jgi:hypothetical protein